MENITYLLSIMYGDGLKNVPFTSKLVNLDKSPMYFGGQSKDLLFENILKELEVQVPEGGRACIEKIEDIPNIELEEVYYERVSNHYRVVYPHYNQTFRVVTEDDAIKLTEWLKNPKL